MSTPTFQTQRALADRLPLDKRARVLARAVERLHRAKGAAVFPAEIGIAESVLAAEMHDREQDIEALAVQVTENQAHDHERRVREREVFDNQPYGGSPTRPILITARQAHALRLLLAQNPNRAAKSLHKVLAEEMKDPTLLLYGTVELEGLREQIDGELIRRTGGEWR